MHLDHWCLIKLAIVADIAWENIDENIDAQTLAFSLWFQVIGIDGTVQKIDCASKLQNFADVVAVAAEVPDDGASGRKLKKSLKRAIKGLKVDERVHREHARKGAKHELQLSVNQFGLNISHEVLRKVVSMQRFYANIERWKMNMHLRPAVEVDADPRAWWMFAIRCMIKTIHEKSMATIMERIRFGREYASLFRRTFAPGRAWIEPLSEAEEARYNQLELQLPMRMLHQRRLQAWFELHQQEQNKDQYMRDQIDILTEIEKTGARSWTENELDTVLMHGSLHYEKSPTKVPKEKWVEIVQVGRFLSTTFSGWARLPQEKKKGPKTEKWDKAENLWFRLRGDVLYFYSGVADGKPKGQIVISETKSMDIEFADRTVIKIDTDKRLFLIKYESIAKCEAWFEQLVNVYESCDYPHCSQRWAIMYKNEGDVKPIDAIPLNDGCYTIVLPTVAVKNFPFCIVIKATLLTFQQKEFMLATAEADELTTLSALLAPGAGKTLHSEEQRVLTEALSVNQAAMISGVMQGGGDVEVYVEEDVDEDSDDEGSERENADASLSDYFKARLELKFEEVSVTLGAVSYNWVSASLSGVSAVFETTAKEALNVDFNTSSIEIVDSYSRETCYRKLFFRDIITNKPMVQLTASSVNSWSTAGDLRVERYLAVVIQPMHIVCNPVLVPALLGFVQLVSDEGVEQLQQEMQRKVQAGVAALANNSLLSMIIQSASTLSEAKDTAGFETRLRASVKLGSIHVVLPNEFYTDCPAALSAVVSIAGLDIRTDEAPPNVHRRYDTFHATLRSFEAYCCHRDDLMIRYGNGDRSAAWHLGHHSPRFHSQSDETLNKRYLVTPITLPLEIGITTGLENVDSVTVRAEMSLSLLVTTVALREFTSIVTSSYNTMNVRRNVAKVLVSTAADRARQKSPRLAADSDNDHFISPRAEETQSTTPDKLRPVTSLSLSVHGRSASSDSMDLHRVEPEDSSDGGDGRSWLSWASFKPANFRAELLVHSANISVGIGNFGPSTPAAGTMSPGSPGSEAELPKDALISVQTTNVKFSFVSRTKYDCYDISMATLCTKTRLDTNITQLDAGIVHIVPVNCSKAPTQYEIMA
eukprot:SAG11_NODE_69_length_18453_cov_37.601613_16_plen_1100_part_00